MFLKAKKSKGNKTKKEIKRNKVRKRQKCPSSHHQREHFHLNPSSLYFLCGYTCLLYITFTFKWNYSVPTVLWLAFFSLWYLNGIGFSNFMQNSSQLFPSQSDAIARDECPLAGEGSMVECQLLKLKCAYESPGGHVKCKF